MAGRYMLMVVSLGLASLPGAVAWGQDGPVIVTGPPGHHPVISQVGGTTGHVPMRHGRCPNLVDCGTHVLATDRGNLDMNFRVRLSCPENRDVVFLAAAPIGQPLEVIPHGVGQSSFDGQITFQPFSRAEIERACANALGGPWPLPGAHNNQSPTVQTTITERIFVRGRCSGLPAETRSTVAAVSLTCNDTHFFPPVR